MMHVIVILMGGGAIAYERGSRFQTDEHWLTILSPDLTTHLAAFPMHRVTRVFYADNPNNRQGVSVVASVGL